MQSAGSELTRPDGTPLRVLVVDDEENIAELLRMALRYEGWDVEVALSGTKAVGTVKRQRPDAVVLDMMLPSTSMVRRWGQHDLHGPSPPLTARARPVRTWRGCSLSG